MSARPFSVAVIGRDAELWLAAAVIRRALGASGVTVDAVELPSAIGPADAFATLPPLEALHNQLGIDEAALLRLTQGAYALGQNFADAAGALPPFLHAYGSAGTAIEGRDFFPFWLKARAYGMSVGIEDFSLTAAAARHGRLMLPDDETERYGRADYGYHLPAPAYARTLRDVAGHHGVRIHAAAEATPLLDAAGGIAAVALDGDRRIEADLFVDASGAEARLIGALGGPVQSWRAHFPAEQMLVARGGRFASVPVYAEVRASASGWTAILPGQAASHVRHVWCGDGDPLREAEAVSRLALGDAAVRPLDPGRRARAWQANCVAIGAAAAAFDPVVGVELHAVQLGLILLLAHFPASPVFAAQRDEFNRLAASAFDRIRDFQSAHHAAARYPGAFWDAARAATVTPEAAHRIALFEARGEIAPYEDDSFDTESWRALLTGHGLRPQSWLPVVDRTDPEAMKAQFRRMLGYVRETVTRQPTHDSLLAEIARG